MQVARILGTAVIALGLMATAPAQAQDKAKGKGGEKQAVTKVLLENDKVRVTQTSFAPGAFNRSDRKERTNYIVKGSMLERTTPDGKKTTYERKAGEAHYLKADSDTVRNIGKTQFVVVTVVHK
jgi:YD repeat-containing protein